MANNAGDSNADMSSDSSVLDLPDGTPPLVEEDPNAEPGSRPLIGVGLQAQLPNFWLSGGASKAHTLGSFPKHYMSRHGLPPEESSELVAVAIAVALKESSTHKILRLIHVA